MSDQNSTTPDPSDAVPGYQPPSTSQPDAPVTPPSYTPPAGAEPPAYTPPPAGGYEPPAGGYEPPAAGGYSAPAAGGYEPPASGSVPPGAGFPPPPGQPPADPYGASGAAYPPLGGAYPPPGGAYPPPPYAEGAYAGAPASTLNIGDAVSYAWKKFSAAPLPFILIALIIGAVSGVIYLIGTAVSAGMIAAATSGPYGEVNQGALVGGLIVLFVVIAVGVFAALVANVGLQRAAIDTVRGRPVSVGSSFRTDNIGQYIVLYLILVAAYAVVTIVLSLIPVLGSIIAFLLVLAASVMFFFAPYYVLDKGMSAMDALKASYAAARANIGQVILVVIVTGLLASIGSVICGIGALVTLPLALIAAAYSYVVLQGEIPAP